MSTISIYAACDSTSVRITTNYHFLLGVSRGDQYKEAPGSFGYKFDFDCPIKFKESTISIGVFGESRSFSYKRDDSFINVSSKFLGINLAYYLREYNQNFSRIVFSYGKSIDSEINNSYASLDVFKASFDYSMEVLKNDNVRTAIIFGAGVNSIRNDINYIHINDTNQSFFMSVGIGFDF